MISNNQARQSNVPGTDQNPVEGLVDFLNSSEIGISW